MCCSSSFVHRQGEAFSKVAGWGGSIENVAGDGVAVTEPAGPFVLVIDRFPGVVTLIQLALRSRHVRVVTAADHETARALLRGHAAEDISDETRVAKPDVALIGLTGGDLRFGAEAARIVREEAPEIPIVLLTSTESAGLAAGTIRADDEVSAPWDLDTLEFRLRTAQSRALKLAAADVLVFGELRLDLRERLAVRGEVRLSLAGTEWRLLEMLAHAAGKPVPGDVLLEAVWGALYRSDDAYLRAWIRRLNRKLDAGGEAGGPLVQVVDGGYLLPIPAGA